MSVRQGLTVQMYGLMVLIYMQTSLKLLILEQEE